MKNPITDVCQPIAVRTYDSHGFNCENLIDKMWPAENESSRRSGQKGEPGSCTCNETAIIASFTMPKMIQGPKGETGLPGKEGKQGQMGLTVFLTHFYI